VINDYDIAVLVTAVAGAAGGRGLNGNKKPRCPFGNRGFFYYSFEAKD
jgi:hypothetical protein